MKVKVHAAQFFKHAPHLFVRRARGDLAAVRAEPHAVHKVRVLVVVRVVHLERRSLVKNGPGVLARGDNSVRSLLPVVAADHSLRVPCYLSEVAARVPHESPGVDAGPCPTAHDSLALRAPGEVLDGSPEPEHLDLHLVFRVVPCPDAYLFQGREIRSAPRAVETTKVRIRYDEYVLYTCYLARSTLLVLNMNTAIHIKF